MSMLFKFEKQSYYILKLLRFILFVIHLGKNVIHKFKKKTKTNVDMDTDAKPVRKQTRKQAAGIKADSLIDRKELYIYL